MIATTADPFGAVPEAPAAEDRTESRLQRLRQSNLDLRNTWQIIAGSLLLPLGIALILLAWSGAAHGRVDQQQIPYLVSGGIGGLAVVMIGCFFYWAHWLYRIYDQADLHHQEAMREQRELMRALIEAVAASGGRVDLPHEAIEAVGLSTNGIRTARTFVATPTGTNFHSAGCPMVANRSSNLRSLTEDQIGDMKPCRVCDPLVSAG
ncbi:MAG TPA: hypothetical protein VG435_15300 [Acidimicrobiales bacterium]|nr:hypothetical protein [Acidimicrobiales bacterium]